MSYSITDATWSVNNINNTNNIYSQKSGRKKAILPQQNGCVDLLENWNMLGHVRVHCVCAGHKPFTKLHSTHFANIFASRYTIGTKKISRDITKHNWKWSRERKTIGIEWINAAENGALRWNDWEGRAKGHSSRVDTNIKREKQRGNVRRGEKEEGGYRGGGGERNKKWSSGAIEKALSNDTLSI